MAIYIPGALGIPEKGAKYICIRADGTVTNLHGEPLGVTALNVKDHGNLMDEEDVRAALMCLKDADCEGCPNCPHFNFCLMVSFTASDICAELDLIQPVISADKEGA